MIYLISAIALLIAIVGYVNKISLREQGIDTKKFDNPLYNLFYMASCTYPIKLLLNKEEELSEKELKLKIKLQALNLSDRYTIHSYLAMRYILFLSAIIVYAIVVFITRDNQDVVSHIGNTMPMFAILIMIAFIPNIILTIREKKMQKFYGSQVSLLELFTILMVNSNATIEDILFAFSKMNTFYSRVFQKAYRISLRSKEDALNYLAEEFNQSAFGNTFSILRDMFNYSKKDCVRILETNMRAMEEFNLNEQRAKDMKKFAFSQMSMVVPFLIAILLGAVPLIQYGMKIMTEAISFI